MNEEKNAYILGTEREELHRLGLQHQVWAMETRAAWSKAGFSDGDVILDLGSGPGFASMELAYLVGAKGKVISVDRSKQFLNFIESLNEQHQLNIHTIHSEFDDLELEENTLDGVYIRWAIAWVPNPKAVLSKVYKALKPGAKIVIHEYFEWRSFQFEPEYSALKKGITAVYHSFGDSMGNIDIGRKLPKIFREIGFKIQSKRPLQKMASPHDLSWQWPYTFLNIYMPKIVAAGHLGSKELTMALEQLENLNMDADSVMISPTLIELIASK